MSPVECAAWVGGTWLAIAVGWAIVRAAAWVWRLHADADQWIRDAIDQAEEEQQ